MQLVRKSDLGERQLHVYNVGVLEGWRTSPLHFDRPWGMFFADNGCWLPFSRGFYLPRPDPLCFA